MAHQALCSIALFSGERMDVWPLRVKIMTTCLAGPGGSKRGHQLEEQRKKRGKEKIMRRHSVLKKAGRRTISFTAVDTSNLFSMSGHSLAPVIVLIRYISTFRKEKRQKKFFDENVLLLTHCGRETFPGTSKTSPISKSRMSTVRHKEDIFVGIFFAIFPCEMLTYV